MLVKHNGGIGILVWLEVRGCRRLLVETLSVNLADMFIEAYETRFHAQLAALPDINDSKLLATAMDRLQQG